MEEKKKIGIPYNFRRKKQLEKDLAHVTQQMYRRNFELAQTNVTLSLLRKIDSLVLDSQESLDTLGDQIVGAIVSSTECSFLTILVHKADNKEFLGVFGLAFDLPLTSSQNNWFRKLRINIDDPWLKSEQQDLLIDSAASSATSLKARLLLDEVEFKNAMARSKINSLYLIKLRARKKLVGVMAIGFTETTHEVTIAQQEQFVRLSEAVGVAVDSKLLFEENQTVLRQLRKTNQKLRVLDQTKDEFISMASHQLRTPLTSVKGYVSMVLEGDAGKISPLQRKLLDQAFLSSQRMVYLIADLLNVSRLRTGKFLIEPKPANLADIVEAEIGQLTETAKAREIELVYDKPLDIQPLMLDETKIRQVIMNFIDNAIYYTPTGGHITVSITDKPESVEFTVKDDGIGVPKHEQHHLFNKFYRAGNARKARPDGTGLGLFMAKKVVVAQGGGIIFKSQEGKGSTFGFTLAKAALQVKTPDPHQ